MRAQLAFLSVAAFLVAAAAEALEGEEENSEEGVCSSYAEAESELCADDRGWLSAKGGLAGRSYYYQLVIYVCCFVRGNLVSVYTTNQFLLGVLRE